MTTGSQNQPLRPSWPASLPNGCKSCGTREHRHYGRSLCGACYQYLDRRGRLGQYPPLPHHGNQGTDSWARSPRNLVVYRNHKRLRAAAWERQRRLWHTDGAIIRPESCVVLPSPPPRPTFPAWGGGGVTATARGRLTARAPLARASGAHTTAASAHERGST